MRLLMVFLTSSMDGLRLGSLSQQRVIRVSIGSGRSLTSGGLVPENRVRGKQMVTSGEEDMTSQYRVSGTKITPNWVSTVSPKLCISIL